MITEEYMKVKHCIYYNHSSLEKDNWQYIAIPVQFQELLSEKANKWKKEIIEFTIIHDIKNEIWTIGITHPTDNFNRIFGTKIVLGRLWKFKNVESYRMKKKRTIHKLEK
jgi:hypothetical protein